MPTRRRLTVLKAPGGFGKSTLLAECCRRLRDEGVALAWITVDEHDEPAVLDTCIAFACQRAGAGDSAGAERPATAAPSTMPEPGGGAAGSRTRLAVRDIAAVDGPFVVVCDELERLADPRSAELLDFLIRQGPPNLHLAFACRELPAGLDIAGAVLDGHALMLSADDLRFSKAEVADFFEGRLSRPRLARLMTETAGWPFALRISRNDMQGGGRPGAHTAGELAKNWVESRLLARLAADDRQFLLELSLFEWMHPALLDEALQRSDSARRIEAMVDLAGLLEPVREGQEDVWRLHPLIREHCARRLYRESPERFRAVHRRIAGALARRGETAAAMRHAIEADQPARAGEILERAGGVRLWLRDGEAGFLAAGRLLREDVAESRPRLALARCLVLILSGRLEEARQSYRSASAAIGDLKDGMSDAELQMAAENCVVRGTLALHGGERFGSRMVRTEIAERARLADAPGIDALVRGFLEHGLCIARSMTARFGAALEHAARARRLAGGSAYMAMLVDLVVGQAAMARGQCEEAAAHYRRARRTARKTYLLDPLGAAGAAGRLAPNSAPFQPCAADYAAAIELKLLRDGADAALAAADPLLEAVRAAALPALTRLLCALRVQVLAIAGRLDEAEQAWAGADLPADPADCLDLEGQTWREMEALCSARLRLMIERGRFGEARDFARELCAAARERELQRTRMRALALWVALESRAGDAAAAGRRLEEYLRLYAETPYAGPLVRERSDCAGVVEAFVEASAESAADDEAAGEAAQSLLSAIGTAEGPHEPAMSEREREVLQQLEGRSDKQIAAVLGLSPHGVRYHLRKLFTRLGTRDRREAVRRAYEMGLLAEDS